MKRAKPEVYLDRAFISYVSSPRGWEAHVILRCKTKKLAQEILEKAEMEMEVIK